MWLLSRLTLGSGQDELFWPLILRGVGLGLMFVPLTNATVAGLPMRSIGQGTGLFNLMRQLGGSLGIAIMATMLSRLTKVEKAVLTDHVGTLRPGHPRAAGRADARLDGARHGRGRSPSSRRCRCWTGRSRRRQACWRFRGCIW